MRVLGVCVEYQVHTIAAEQLQKHNPALFHVFWWISRAVTAVFDVMYPHVFL